MSGPGPTMKGIQKRFYTVLPRVVASTTTPSRVRSSRALYTSSSSALPLAFLDPPPPPSSRPGSSQVLSTTHLLIEAKSQAQGQLDVSSQQAPQGNGSQSTGHPPFSLALALQRNTSLTLSPGQYSYFPFSPFCTMPYYTCIPSASDSRPSPKRQRLRYQLDVGAYGIPKRCRTNIIGGRDTQGNHTPIGNGNLFHTRAGNDLNLAVQVGEDAYFVRDNAMGVADGVGGWARVRHSGLPTRSPSCPTPSALFANRLMHFCSAEIESLYPSTSPIPTPTFRPSSPCPPKPPRSLRPTFHSYPQSHHPTIISTAPILCHWPDTASTNASASEQQEDLENSLEELEEGLDVLMILERAYERTLEAHVIPAQDPPPIPAPPPQQSSLPTQPMPIPPVYSSSSSFKFPSPLSPSPPNGARLGTNPLLAGSSTVLLAVLDDVPRHSTGTAALLRSTTKSKTGGYDAVIKIAHIGDCMGILIRGENIVWRSEEMWWGFNTPVQLGPVSPSSPSTSAHLFTLPVQADDILILASDGLSDNLWDEDVVDEVVRFRKAFLAETNGDVSGLDGPAARPPTPAERILRRRTLAGMLSEALCSRARRVSERHATEHKEDNEVPFARRAREQGKVFKGGKNDDISVIVAIISPATDITQQNLQHL